MTKQEEVFYILRDVRLGELTEYEATLKLQELGVAIRVDRELPVLDYDRESLNRVSRNTIKSMIEAGYGAFEPLIKGVKS